MNGHGSTTHVPFFAINANNNLEQCDSARIPARLRNAEHFTTEKELNALAAAWLGSRLVEIWNRLPGVNPVTRFTDRKTAVRRIWKALQERGDPDAPTANATK